jgi:hypothetical protein
VKNLSVQRLRKIILEELEKMILNDDALFSRDDISDTGTGTIIGLSVVDDDDDSMYPYDDDTEDDMHHTPNMSHGAKSSCPSDDHDDDATRQVISYILNQLN